MKHLSQKGFTLVEIMIIVALIAILAAIAIPNLLRAQMTSNAAHAKATLRAISTALEGFMAINTTYPTDSNDLLGAAPPYLSVDYFNGAHGGYVFNETLAPSSYQVVASPARVQMGTKSFTLSTGGLITEN